MYDPIQLELFKNRFASIAEEMGVVLRRSSYSPNIKERLDFSCAIFDASGQMVSQAAHIPVHLGAMPISVKAAIGRLTMAPGDAVILNDPYAGGYIVTHYGRKYAATGLMAVQLEINQDLYMDGKDLVTDRVELVRERINGSFEAIARNI